MEEMNVSSSTSASLSLRESDHGDEYLSWYELLTPLVRRWRSLLVLPLLMGGAAGLTTFLLHARYQATTTFTAEGAPRSAFAGSIASLSGLAGELGLPLGISENSLSPNFFATILMSRELATTTLLAEVSDSAAGVRAPSETLLNVLRVAGKTEAARLEKGVKLLHKRMNVQVDKASGLITLQVEMPSAALAADVANGMVTTLNTFNLQRRQSQSREQRRFIEERLESSKQELQQAEKALETFLETNRDYAQSPLLLFQERRLERNVQLRQELVLALAKSYDEARIAEVRDTPVLTIVDAAVPPTRRSWPRTWLFMLLGALLGGVIALGTAYVREWRPAEDTQAGTEYARFRQELHVMRSQLKDMLRLRAGRERTPR
jgi:uncharacterized protein involved in exopolysaccharide biosynthesis